MNKCGIEGVAKPLGGTEMEYVIAWFVVGLIAWTIGRWRHADLWKHSMYPEMEYVNGWFRDEINNLLFQGVWGLFKVLRKGLCTESYRLKRARKESARE